MRLFCLVFLLLLPGIVFSESPKKLTITGATWGSPSGEKNNPVKTHIIETDSLGQITKVYNTRFPESGMLVIYSDNKVEFSFGGGSEVKIEANMAWEKHEDGKNQIEYFQQNVVPESVVNGKKYPGEIIKKAFSILLHIEGQEKYFWEEKRAYSWLPEDGNSRYLCLPGKQVIWTQLGASPNDEYKRILDGKTSNSSADATGKIFYTKMKNSVVGNYYWTYEPSAWDESTWKKGGRIEYSGDSLSTNNPVINVVNYYILKLWFSSNAWHYFGPTLFDIPVR